MKYNRKKTATGTQFVFDIIDFLDNKADYMLLFEDFFEKNRKETSVLLLIQLPIFGTAMSVVCREDFEFQLSIFNYQSNEFKL